MQVVYDVYCVAVYMCMSCIPVKVFIYLFISVLGKYSSTVHRHGTDAWDFLLRYVVSRLIFHKL
jgi:hypothetical protein